MTFELNKQASFHWTNITIFMRQDIKSRHVRSKSFTWPNPQHQHEGLHCCCSHCLLCGRQVKNAIITRLLICHTNLFCIWWSQHTMKLQYMRNTRLKKKQFWNRQVQGYRMPIKLKFYGEKKRRTLMYIVYA